MGIHPIYKALEAGPLLFDGATGTYAKTLEDFPQGSVELACLSAPDQVEALHRAYIDAGSRMIKTNTFAAHVGQAARDSGHQIAIVHAAYGIAMRAAKESGAFVFADIGPAPAQANAVSAYLAMTDAFLDAGADCFLFETMPSAGGICEAARHIRQKRPDAFIGVSFAADPDGFTRSGESAQALMQQMEECRDIDAVGLNCICGAYHMRRLLEGMEKAQKILMAMPNAGYPHVIEGRTYYDSDPAYYAKQVAACMQGGARIIGGCCGTTPEHIRQIGALLHLPQVSISLSRRDAKSGVRGVCRSGVKQKLDAGGRAILVELDPPGNSEIEKFLAGAKSLADAGADAITIADCPIGRARMDSSLLACKLRRELGIEALPHMTCRDRNVNATKALLLGLSMEGVHNVLAVTGDPVPTSDRGSVKSVFQFNSRVLARFVRSLSASGETEPFFLCGALNVNAVNFEMELARAKEKEACGVEAFLTQPVLSEQAARNIEQARSALSGRIFGGLFPVVSHKNACFLNSEVAGITVDPKIIQAYEGLDRAQGEALAVRLCEEAAKRIAPFVDGYYIMTPFQRVELVKQVIARI